MPTYTVHEPPLRKGEAVPNADRFAFVRDGFYFWAFLLPPVWMLLHRLWMVLLLYVIVNAIIGVALFALGAPAEVKFIAGVLIGLLAGLEAATLWRWTLTRRKWKTVAVVIGEDRELAERRFFAAWQQRAPETPAPPPSSPPQEPRYTAPVRRGPPSGSDIIGLFPEPGGPR
ncbi:MAG: DUF2628 domain-containing protein [Pseudolabrys sp.]